MLLTTRGRCPASERASSHLILSPPQSSPWFPFLFSSLSTFLSCSLPVLHRSFPIRTSNAPMVKTQRVFVLVIPGSAATSADLQDEMPRKLDSVSVSVDTELQDRLLNMATGKAVSSASEDSGCLFSLCRCLLVLRTTTRLGMGCGTPCCITPSNPVEPQRGKVAPGAHSVALTPSQTQHPTHHTSLHPTTYTRTNINSYTCTYPKRFHHHFHPRILVAQVIRPALDEARSRQRRRGPSPCDRHCFWQDVVSVRWRAVSPGLSEVKRHLRMSHCAFNVTFRTPKSGSEIIFTAFSIAVHIHTSEASEFQPLRIAIASASQSANSLGDSVTQRDFVGRISQHHSSFDRKIPRVHS